MGNNSHALIRPALTIAVLTVFSSLARAVPWNTYCDPESDSCCAVVNAANAELVVLASTGQMVLVTGSDLVLLDTFVDLDGWVFFEGDPGGFIEFATDGDGLRTLWWFMEPDDVVRVDLFTGRPSGSGLPPIHFVSVACDACQLWDDPTVCAAGRIPADAPQAPCTGCGDCSCATCEDGRIELCEVIGYACAWLTGCNDNLADMTRAAYLWMVGECYCWDETQGNWHPSVCPPPTFGYCEPGVRDTKGAVASPPTPQDQQKKAVPQMNLGRYLPRREGGGSKSATPESDANREADVPSKRRSHSGQPRARTLPISIPATPGSSVVALECRVPEGWQVLDISDGGVWDGFHRKVKWGPFFGDLSRTVLLQVRSLSGHKNVAGFGATVSMDGVNQSIQLE